MDGEAMMMQTSGKPWNDVEITVWYLHSSGDEERLYTTAEELLCNFDQLWDSNYLLLKSWRDDTFKAVEIIFAGHITDIEVAFEMIAIDREHINDLVKAFMTIRYPGVSIWSRLI